MSYKSYKFIQIIFNYLDQNCETDNECQANEKCLRNWCECVPPFIQDGLVCKRKNELNQL